MRSSFSTGPHRAMQHASMEVPAKGTGMEQIFRNAAISPARLVKSLLSKTCPISCDLQLVTYSILDKSKIAKKRVFFRSHTLPKLKACVRASDVSDNNLHLASSN